MRTLYWLGVFNVSCSPKNPEKEIKLQPCCREKASLSNRDDSEEDLSSYCSHKADASHKEGKKVNLTIRGMDCPSCALSVEKGMSKLPGIQSAKASYATEKLHIIGNDLYDEKAVEKTIKNLGFTLETHTHDTTNNRYTIGGMDCANCATSIEKHLMTIGEVDEVQVSFATGKAYIKHSNGPDDIVQEMKKIGYTASFDGDEDSAKTMDQHSLEIGKIILSGLFIATGFVFTYTSMPTMLSTILFAIVIVLSGAKPMKSAYYAVKSKSLDMNVLISTAVIGAMIIGEWFEGATVVWLFSFGMYLQNRSMDQTRKSIRDLMNVAPSKAWVQAGDTLIQKPVEQINIGDMIIVKPGDKIPLDGNITKGSSMIHQAPITGESMPVEKAVGDPVFAGTINESGSLDIEVTTLIEDTTLSKIIHLVEEAQEQKAPTEAFIDRFAAIYTPIVFVIALLVIALPPLFGLGNWTEWAYKGIALLVIACPCALVISTPVAIVSGIGNAAKNGVLMKGGTFLEIAGSIDSIAFDKTGTLTKGTPTVSEIYAIDISEKELLSIAQTIESRSSHPIAKALIDYATEEKIPPLEGEMYQNIVGKGVQATIAGDVYMAGSPRLFTEMNVSLDRITHIIQTFEREGKTSVVIGTKDHAIGAISFADTIRPQAKKTIQALKEAGVRDTIMLTGDNERTAKTIAAQTGVDRYFAELLPEDKVTAVKEIQHEGRKVAMVGDGINDAPALATADLGIAMGVVGTDTAMETADVVLMSDDLEKLPYTATLSKRAIHIIKQNIWFSILIKVAALILIFPGWLTLWMAVLSDTGAAVLVILNALRLLRV